MYKVCQKGLDSVRVRNSHRYEGEKVQMDRDRGKNSRYKLPSLQKDVSPIEVRSRKMAPCVGCIDKGSLRRLTLKMGEEDDHTSWEIPAW